MIHMVSGLEVFQMHNDDKLWAGHNVFGMNRML